MKAWGAEIASEGRQRSLMKEQLENVAVKAETVPFTFEKKHGGQELRPAPIAYIDDLKALVFHLLDEHQR
jgi:hypothetical protein